MIPKIIHYCWFGRGDKPKLVNKCIESWHKKLSDYEIKEWNEDNFNVSANDFVKSAYSQKKWAFVADYCRLYVLFKYGGIYLDTDVEVIKSFNELITTSFIGYEQNRYICTAVMGFEKGNALIKKMIGLYDEGGFDCRVPNSKHFFNELYNEYKLQALSSEPILLKDISVYPVDYFSPKDFVTKKINITKNTFCIHHFDGTWKSGGAKMKDSIQNLLIRILGYDRYYKLKGKLKK